MQKISVKLLIILAAFLLGCVSTYVIKESVWKLSADNPENITKWEYLLGTSDSKSEVSELANKYGQEGWEMVSYSFATVSDTVIFSYSFKRPLK